MMEIGERRKGVNFGPFFTNRDDSYKSLFEKCICGNEELGKVFKKLISFYALTDDEYRLLDDFVHSDSVEQIFGKKYQEFLVSLDVLIFRGKNISILSNVKEGEVLDENYSLSSDGLKKEYSVSLMKILDSNKMKRKGKMRNRKKREKRVTSGDCNNLVRKGKYLGSSGARSMKLKRRDFSHKNKTYFYLELIERIGRFVIGTNLKTGELGLYDVIEGLKVGGRKKLDIVGKGEGYVLTKEVLIFENEYYDVSGDVEEYKNNMYQYFIDYKNNIIICASMRGQGNIKCLHFDDIIGRYGNYIVVSSYVTQSIGEENEEQCNYCLVDLSRGARQETTLFNQARDLEDGSLELSTGGNDIRIIP